MNKKLLDATLILHDCTKKHAAEVMDVDYSTFTRKCKNNSFTVEQVNRLKEGIGLSAAEVSCIFFT